MSLLVLITDKFVTNPVMYNSRNNKIKKYFFVIKKLLFSNYSVKRKFRMKTACAHCRVNNKFLEPQTYK